MSILQKLMLQMKTVVMVSRSGLGPDVVIHQLNYLDPGGGWQDCKRMFPTALNLGGALDHVQRMLHGRGMYVCPFLWRRWCSSFFSFFSCFGHF